MITLRAGAAECAVEPARGAAVSRLALGGRDLLVPVRAGEDPSRGFHGAYLLAPWANRLDGGRIEVGGVVHHMPVNHPSDGTALHGFLRDMPWSVERAGPSAATLACAFDRPPFRGEARLDLRLVEDGLEVALALTSAADRPTPMGLGWHPYFPRPSGTRLSVAARTVFGRDARNLPIAPRPTTGLVGGDGVLEGLDTHLAGWDGDAWIAWPDGASLRLSARGAWASNLQVFAPRGHAVLAVEPVSHAPDAPNRPAAAAHGAMHVLARGATLEGSLMIHWRA